MKRRALIVTLAAGAALASPGARPAVLSFNDAIEIARHEIERRGLASTHHAAALYAGEDKHTEGAAFAVIIRPRVDAPSKLKRTAAAKLKLLIQEDGRTSLQRIKSRISRRPAQPA